MKIKKTTKEYIDRRLRRAGKTSMKELMDDLYKARRFVIDRRNRERQRNFKNFENQVLNKYRVINCMCGSRLVGSHDEWMNLQTPAHLYYGCHNVFDPVCSNKCRRKYDMYCTNCKAPLGRIYGLTHNGELRCLERCYQ